MIRVASLFVLLFIAAIFSQPFGLAATNDPPDTAKIRAYFQLSYNSLYQDPSDSAGEKAQLYADSLQQLSGELDYKAGQISAFYLYALINHRRGNYDEALNQLETYVDYYTQLGDSNRLAQGLYTIGLIHSARGDYETNLAIQFRIAAIYERLNNQTGLANALNSIANVYRRTGKYADAREMHTRAAEIYKKEGESKRYAMSLSNLANIYVSENQFDSARHLYEQALTTIQELGFPVEEALILSNLGYLSEQLDQNELALQYHFKAMAIEKKTGEEKGLAQTLDNIGYLYLKQKEYKTAKKYFHEALNLAQRLELKPVMAELYRELAEVAAGEGDFAAAYRYKGLQMQMKDSVLNEETSRQINELQTRYETEKKDRQITLLDKERELQEKEAERQAAFKKTFIAGIILISLLAGSVIYTISQRLKNQKALAAKNEEVQEANFQRKLTELEMKALRAQINPHFLFNCMNSINRMILAGEMDNASRYLTKFSKLVRLILENSMLERVSLTSELAMLESYIHLEELRFKEKICFSVSVDDQVDRESPLIPPMILQPFVENAIWHGLMHRDKKGEGEINIAIREEGDRLWCRVEDNGVGREKAASLRENNVFKSKSLGIKITGERLRLLNRDKVEELIRFTDLKDEKTNATGTRVEIGVPII